MPFKRLWSLTGVKYGVGILLVVMIGAIPIKFASTPVPDAAPVIVEAEAPKKPERVPQVNVTRVYNIFWMGMHIGDLVAQVEELPKGLFRMESSMYAKGMIKKLTRFQGTSNSISVWQPDALVIPNDFTMEINYRKRGRMTRLHYDPEGNVIKESVVPPDNREKRPAVRKDRKKGAIDPHTMVLRAHQLIREGLKPGGKKEFALITYDGRKLSEMKFAIIGKTIWPAYDKEKQVYHIQMTRKALEGFTESELERIKSEDPVIDLYLEDNADMLPVGAVASAPIGSAFAVIGKECYSVKRCEDTPEGYRAKINVPW